MLDIIKRAAVMVGGVTELAKLLGAPRPALYVWKKVPAVYVLKMEDATNGRLKRWDIREDLHPREDFFGRKRKFEVKELS
jgi:DNA-binding transcriptional regulator YdaS (Cro superfamily)